MFLKAFISIIVLIAGYKGLYFINNKIVSFYPAKTKVNSLISILEIISWMIFMSWFLRSLYTRGNMNVFIAISVLMVMFAIPSLFYIEDFVIGVVMKMQNRVFPGNKIKLNGIEGEIKRTGNTRLEIIDKNNIIHSVSYREVNKKIISTPETNIGLYKIRFKYIFEGKVQEDELLNNLRLEMLNNSFVAVSSKPVIEYAAVQANKYVISIAVYTLQSIYWENIKRSMEDYFISKNIKAQIEIECC